MPSHNLLIEYIKENFKNDLKNKTIIEIGCTREFIGIQNSSEDFIKFCKDNSMNFISIDMDPECSNNVKNLCNKYNFNNYIIKTMKGEDFLLNYNNKIDFIYLDAFDFWHNNHSYKRLESYKKNMNVTITNDDKLCHKMHYDCVYNMINNGCIKKSTVICHDDIITEDASVGKGKLSIPYLLDNNFKIVTYDNKTKGMLLVPL